MLGHRGISLSINCVNSNSFVACLVISRFLIPLRNAVIYCGNKRNSTWPLFGEKAIRTASLCSIITQLPLSIMDVYDSLLIEEPLIWKVAKDLLKTQTKCLVSLVLESELNGSFSSWSGPHMKTLTEESKQI